MKLIQNTFVGVISSKRRLNDILSINDGGVLIKGVDGVKESISLNFKNHF